MTTKETGYMGFIGEFLKTAKFSAEYNALNRHYIANNNSEAEENSERDLAKDFLENAYEYGIKFGVDTEDEKEKIDQYLNEYADDRVDIYNEDLYANITRFWDWIEDFWDKDTIHTKLMSAQSLAYREVLQEVVDKYTEFLASRQK